MPRRLPLFPLPVVLFPGTPMPLHIFEPRYRTMLADCLEGDERFGLIYAPDAEPPAPGTVGCIAHIVASTLLPDGRSDIVVTGEDRFVLDRYLVEELPYAVGWVSEIEDAGPAPVTAEQFAELRRLGEAYLTALHHLNDIPSATIPAPGDAGAFSFQLAAGLELPPEIKQGLLAVRSPAVRVQELLKLLPPLVRELEDRARVHVRARSNGRSHRPWPGVP